MANQEGARAEAPQVVDVRHIKISFMDLTFFFVKASFAAALAALLTGALWLVIAGGFLTALAMFGKAVGS